MICFYGGGAKVTEHYVVWKYNYSRFSDEFFGRCVEGLAGGGLVAQGHIAQVEHRG